MGKQFDRLFCEELKQYYIENFNEYRNVLAVIKGLSGVKQDFVSRLYGDLKVGLDNLPNEKGTIQKETLAAEIHKLMQELEAIKIEFNKKRKELDKDDKYDPMIGELKARVLEEKLDLIEEELIDKGIVIKMVDNKIVFEEKEVKPSE